MLESLVTNLLNTYLSQFLEGLDKDQMKISIWGGSVNLENVKVKSSALDLLHLPVVVKYGFVKKLHLSANWRKLSSQPVKVELSGVYIVAVPSAKATVDSAQELQNALVAKMTRLQGLEDLRFGESEDDDGSSGGDGGMMGRLASTIVDNMEIVLRDIHVRYEDFSGPHPPTSFGVGLQEMLAQTTDESWKPMFLEKPPPRTFKMLNLTNLFVYMNVNDQAGVMASRIAATVPAQGAGGASSGALTARKGPAVAAGSNPDGAGPDRQLSVSKMLEDSSTAFLLRPVSGHLRMRIEKDETATPRVWVDAQLYDISLQLHELQYAEILGLIERISHAQSGMADLVQSFEEFFREGTVSERREYVNLYKATLNAMWLAPLSDAQKKRKEQLESDLRYDDIRRYRLAAIAELKRELGILGSTGKEIVDAAAKKEASKEKKADRARNSIMLREQAAKLTATFFSKLHLGKAKEIKAERELSESEREELFANVDREFELSNGEVAADFVHVELKFKLETLSFSLVGRDNALISELKAQRTGVDLVVRDSSMSSVLTLETIRMTDQFTKGTLYPDIIRDVDAPSLNNMPSSSSASASVSVAQSHVLRIEVHSPPLDHSCDLKLGVTMRAPQIVLQETFIHRLLEFFMPPNEIDWAVLSAYDSDAREQIQLFSSMNLSEALQSHESMDISLDIKAPTIVLPKDPTSPSSDVLVLDLGAVKLTSRLQPKQELEAFSKQLSSMTAQQQSQLSEFDRRKCYDIRSIAIRQVQVYLTIGSDLLGQAAPPRVFLLNPFDISADIWQCMSSDVVSLPDIRILGELARLDFSLSPSKYTRLMLLLATFSTVLSSFFPDEVANQTSIFEASAARLAAAQKALQASVSSSAASAGGDKLSSKAKGGAAAEDKPLDLASLARLMPSLADAKKLMALIDTDRDGSISRAEFKAWSSARAKARELNETLEVAFKISSCVLTLSNESSRVATNDVLEIKIDGVRVAYKQSTHRLKIGVVVGALSIQDLVSNYAASKFIMDTHRQEGAAARTGGALVPQQQGATPMQTTRLTAPLTSDVTFITDDEFINFSLVSTSDRAEVFAAKPTEVEVKIGFSTVLLCLEPESMKRTGLFLWTVFVNNKAVNSAWSTPTAPSSTALTRSPGLGPQKTKAATPSAPAAASSSASASSSSSSSVSKPSTRASRISLSLQTHFQSLTVQMYSKNDPLAEAVIDSLHTESLIYSTGSLHLFWQLNQVWIKDCTKAGAMYPYAITTRTSSNRSAAASDSLLLSAEPANTLIKIEYDTFAKSETDYPGFGESLTASVHGVQITYLQRFVEEITYFFTQGPVSDLIDFVSAEDPEMAAVLSPQAAALAPDMSTTAANMSQSYSNLAGDRFVKLNLSVTGVDLLVPLHSGSQEMLLARLDKIAMTNGMVADAEAGGKMYPQVTISGTPFSVTSLIQAHGPENRPLLQLSPFNVVINLLAHHSRIAIDVDAQNLVAMLAPAQYQWILTLPTNNMAERATVMKAITKRRPAKKGVAGASPMVGGSGRDLLSPPALSLASGAPAKPQLAPTAVVFKLNATLHQLTFTLTENDHVPAADANGVAKGALAVFEMSELVSGVQILANGGMDVSSWCGTMSMTDISAGGAFVRGKRILPQYRQLLLIVKDQEGQAPAPSPTSMRAASSKTKSKPPVFFTLNKQVDERGTAWSVVELSVANFRFNLGPVLLRLPAFFSPAETKDTLAVLDDLQSGSLALTPTVQAPSVASATPSYMVFKLFVANPIVQLVQDPTSEVSEALLLTFGLHTELLMSSNAQGSILSSDLHLTGFKCYSTRLDVNKIGFVQLSDDTSATGVIVQPFSINGTVKLTTPADAQTAETILEPIEDPTAPIVLPTLKAHLVIDPIMVRISYLTYRLALRTLDALSTATSQEEAEQRAREAASAQKMLEGVATARRTSPKAAAGGSAGSAMAATPGGDSGETDATVPLLEGTSTDDLDAAAIVPKPQVTRLFYAEEIWLEMSEGSLSLINDANGFDIPIARVNVDNVRLQVHGFAHHRAVRADIGISADYYNMVRVVYEPMLEHYELDLDLTQTYILATTEFNRTLDPNAPPSMEQKGGAADSASSSSAVTVLESHKYEAAADHSGALLSTKLLLSSPQPLNLNVTHTMYRGVMECLDLLSVVESDAGKGRLSSASTLAQGITTTNTRNVKHILKDGNKRSGSLMVRSESGGALSSLMDSDSDFYPYRFENWTEFKVDLTQRATGAPEKKDGNDLRLVPYSVLSFDFPPSIHVSAHELAVHVYRSASASVDFLSPMRGAGTKTFQIPLNADGSRSARLIFELLVQDGVKVCRLRGVIGLRNSTIFPLELKSVEKGSETVFPILQPGDSYYMPLLTEHESGGFMVLLRPRKPQDKNSRSMIASEFGWSSPVILLQDFSRQNQYCGCIHQSAMAGSAASVGAVGDVHATEASPVTGIDGNWNCSVHIHHLWPDSGSSTIDEEAPDSRGLKSGQPFTAQIYEIGPALLIQNLLAADAEVRVAERTGTEEIIQWSSTIARGDQKPIHLLINTPPTYLQVRIPSLLTKWSTLLALPQVPPEGHTTCVYPLSLFDGTQRELMVHLEVNIRGTTKVVLYVPYWVMDLSRCGTILSVDGKQTVPLGSLDNFRRQLASDVRSPLMFNFPQGFASKKREVRLTTLQGVEKAQSWNDVQWSAPIGVDKVGLSTTTVIPGAKVAMPGESEPSIRSLSDIGVTISQGSGKYRRTKIIQLSPHYVFKNTLGVDLEFMQRVSLNPELVHSRKSQPAPWTLKAGETAEWHWIDSVANRTVCFRRAGQQFADWRWSGEVDPSVVGDVSIMLRHKSEQNKCAFVRCEIHVQEATVFVQFSEYAAATMHSLLPYRIQNQCIHQPIRVRQYIPTKGSSECKIPVPQCDWITVPSYSVLHFAPEVAIYSRPLRVEIQMGLSYREGTVVAERTCTVNLDEIKSHDKFNCAPSAGDEIGQYQNVYLFTESDGSSNVLKVSNYGSAEDFAAGLRKTKGITQKQVIARQRERRWGELQQIHDALIMRLNMLSKRMAQENSRQSSLEMHADARPKDLSPRESALIVDVQAGRGIRFKGSYIRAVFDGIERKGNVAAGSGNVSYNSRFQFSTTGAQGSSLCRLELREERTFADQTAGWVEFSLYDLDHAQRTSWLPVRSPGGDTIGELQVMLWHVPRADKQQEESADVIESALDEKKRILRSIESEMQGMKDRQMIDSEGRVLAVHLQNDVQYRLELTAIEGLGKALASMNNVGDVVCRIRSELTGKTASVLVMHYDPAVIAAQAAPSGSTSRSPTAAGASSQALAVATARPILIDWEQEISIFVPEEMLSARDEVVHFSFFFHPQDLADDATELSPTMKERAANIKNEAFLRATKLRANCPPIPLAHTSVPFTAIPVFNSPEFKKMQAAAQRDPKQLDWTRNRLPLQSDLYGNGEELWLTLTVVRMEATSEENRSQFSLKLGLPQLSLSLIDATPQEVLFFSVSSISASLDDTLCTQNLEAKIESIQLDNQSVGALFPIVLGFTAVEPEDKQPLLQLSINKKKTTLPIAFFQYASVLLQQLDVNVEEELIYTIIRFVSSFKDDDSLSPLDSPRDESKIFERRRSDYFTINKVTELMLFFEFLQLQPVALNVSFEAAPGMRERFAGAKYNPIQMLLSFAGTAMGSIQSAPIRLNGRTFEHVRGSFPVLLGSLAHFYRGELIGEAYKVIGAFEFLGNPVGLITGLSSGVSDFFWLPAKGVVESPASFGRGLSKGTLSLVKGTIGGVFNTAGSITGSVSKGLAMASGDEAFIEKTGSKQQRAPSNLAEGMFQGGKSLAGGLFKGITGIVTDPYKGARDGGAQGFFRGVGKGLLGVVAKPASGAVGFASQTLTGLGNTPDAIFDSKLHPKHVRPQRYISPETGVEPFNYAKAEKHEAAERIRLKERKKAKSASSAASSSSPKARQSLV